MSALVHFADSIDVSRRLPVLGVYIDIGAVVHQAVSPMSAQIKSSISQRELNPRDGSSLPFLGGVSHN
jgi:hypothetical protein